MYRQPLGSGETATRNTKLVAALATLGIPVRTHRKVRTTTGQEEFTFVLGDHGILPHRPVNTANILWRLITASEENPRISQLAAKDVYHPLLECLRALESRTALVHWMKRGVPCRLVQDVPAARGRCLSSPGHTPANAVTVPVTHLAHAAALAVCGCATLKITGSAGAHVFHVAKIGEPWAGSCDASLILEHHQNGWLQEYESEHPFLWGIQACANFDTLKQLISREPAMLLIEDDKFNSGRAALLFQNHKGEAIEDITRFFAGDF